MTSLAHHTATGDPALLAAAARSVLACPSGVNLVVDGVDDVLGDLTDPDDPEAHQLVSEMLWTVYVMMLENDGRNERQLREYAHMGAWLREYWFDPSGASGARIAIASNQWPRNTELSAVAMWLFWFLLRPGEPSLRAPPAPPPAARSRPRPAEDYFLDELNFPSVMSTLKIIALAAHKVSAHTPPPPHTHTHSRGERSPAIAPVTHREPQWR